MSRPINPVPKPEKTKKTKTFPKKPKVDKTIDMQAVDDKVRQRNNTNRNFGKSVEREVAKRTGGHRVPASGAIKNSVFCLEGDVRVVSEDGKATLVLIETKGSSAISPIGDKTYTLKKSVLDQATKEADLVKALPAIYIHWKNASYDIDDYVIIPSRHFYTIVIPALKEQYNFEHQSQEGEVG